MGGIIGIIIGIIIGVLIGYVVLFFCIKGAILSALKQNRLDLARVESAKLKAKREAAAPEL